MIAGFFGHAALCINFPSARTFVYGTAGGALSFARTTQLTKNLPYRSILGVSYEPRPYEKSYPKPL